MSINALGTYVSIVKAVKKAGSGYIRKDKP